jgi:hypothetical protein
MKGISIMTYKIHDHAITVGGPKKMKYPIKELQIGQAFCAPPEEETALRAAAAYVNARFHKWGIYVSVQKAADGLVWCGRCDVPTERIVFKPKDG